MASDQELNERLAKACGRTAMFVEIHCDGGHYDVYERRRWDPLNNLDDCAELLEEVAVRGQQNDFIAALWSTLELPRGSNFWTIENIHALFKLLNATARQIAQAADKVLGGDRE